MSNLIQRKSRHHGSSLKKDESNVSTLLKTKRNGLKYPRYSKTESSKWKTNNLQLARENARLKKNIQNYIATVNESAIRYENLEVAWRRRGETLSKIDIISRLVGNQISKLVDTLTELRTACQVELSIPLHEALTEPLNQISYLRHSMPVRSDKSIHQTNSRSQLVNHVNPMVSGHPIIKPTITLQRLNLRNVPSNVPREQIQVQSQLLNEVEIPLERLSLAQIAERIGSPVSRNSMSRLEAQGDRSIFASPEMSSHIPMDSILESSETFSPGNNSSARESPRHLVHSPNSHWPEVSFDEGSSVPNRHSNNSARKYSATSRVKTPTSAEQRNRINADVEKCCLVVALKDVGSYLNNGTLTNVELLEERKVKTGASAHSDVKLENSNENDGPHFNISSASGEDQIEVNFTAEIQTMDYGDIPLHNDNEKENSFSATQEFFNRIRNEDPLEGPSWRYENVTTREVKKRHRSQCLNFSPSAKKNKQDNVFPSINKPKKNNILDSSLLFESIDKHLKLELENSFNNGDIDTTEMEFAKCTIVSCEANTNITKEEEKKCNISDVSIEYKDCLESSPGISSCATNNEVNLSLNKIEFSSELEINCKPDKSKSYKNIGQNRTNSCKQNTQKEKCVSKSHSKEEKEKKKSRKCSVKINKKDIKTVPETLVEQIVETRSGSMYEEHSRTRRRVAPKSLKEPMLRSKLRRE